MKLCIEKAVRKTALSGLEVRENWLTGSHVSRQGVMYFHFYFLNFLIGVKFDVGGVHVRMSLFSRR